jgi:hypothetical protein
VFALRERLKEERHLFGKVRGLWASSRNEEEVPNGCMNCIAALWRRKQKTV